MKRTATLALFLTHAGLALLGGAVRAQNAPADGSGAAGPPPVTLTSQQDHQRVMDLLHITTLRTGASSRDQNMDPSKENPYPNLPDPLVLKNGQKVTTPEMWWQQRRPEIVEDFDREIYGRRPKTTPKVNWEVLSTTRTTEGGVAVIKKQLTGHVDNSSYPLVTVGIRLALTVPAEAKGPVPVMMQFSSPMFAFGAFGPTGPRRGGPAAGGMGGFGGMRRGAMTTGTLGRGGAGALAGGMRRGGAMTSGTRGRGGMGGFGGPIGPTWQQQALAKGWGYALIDTGSIQADNGAGLTQGIIGLVNKGQPRKVDDWGVLSAWGWGASRALDYFESDPAVDAKQVGLEGHSRWGKATIVAMAYDPRFAICYVSSSGEGGAKLHRHNMGEVVEKVAETGEYHWMAGNFIKYAGPLTWGDMPVDSHELIAMCAPRPVFIGGGSNVLGNPGSDDAWADPKGMFMAAAGAGPVYELLGKKGLGTTEFPPVETALVDGEVAFRQHNGGHTDGPNWPVFFKYADRYIKAPGLK